MDGIIDEGVVKVGDVEMLEKPNFDECSFSEENGTPAAIPSDSANIASAMATGGGGGTPTAADEEGSDFRFSQGGRGGIGCR